MSASDRAWTRPHSKEELNTVAIAAQTGDGDALHQLAEMMRPYVISMTRKLDRLGGDGYSREMSDELKQSIWVGVWVALPKFDPDADTKFSSYAYFWMRHEAQDWMAKNSRALPLTRVAWAQSLRLERAFRDRYGDEADIYAASDDELAELLIENPKGGGEIQVKHAGAIFRAKGNSYEFDAEFDGMGQTRSAEEEAMALMFDPDEDAIDTLDAMMMASTPDEAMSMAIDYCDRHGFPVEIAEKMMKAKI